MTPPRHRHRLGRCPSCQPLALPLIPKPKPKSKLVCCLLMNTSALSMMITLVHTHTREHCPSIGHCPLYRERVIQSATSTPNPTSVKVHTFRVSPVKLLLSRDKHAANNLPPSPPSSVAHSLTLEWRLPPVHGLDLTQSRMRLAFHRKTYTTQHRHFTRRDLEQS